MSLWPVHQDTEAKGQRVRVSSAVSDRATVFETLR